MEAYPIRPVFEIGDAVTAPSLGTIPSTKALDTDPTGSTASERLCVSTLAGVGFFHEFPQTAWRTMVRAGLEER